MKKPKRARPDDKGQSKAFLEKAREIGADEERSPADELIRRLATTPVKTKEKKPGR